MIREIEEFYAPSDNEDWSFAIERAQASFVPADRGFTLLFRPREYRFSRTIRLIRGMSLVGSGGAHEFSGTLLRFAGGVTGIVCEFPNPVSSPDRGDKSIIERLFLLAESDPGAKPGPPDPCGATGSHGVVMHVPTMLRDVAIAQFSGNGIHICASHGFTPLSGSNLWQIYNCRVVLCGGHGLYVHGDDSNAGCAIALDCEDNSGWGILDESLLNNTYLACHVANGNPKAGNRAYRAAGGQLPRDQAHQEPQPPATRGAGSVFVGCYAEGNMTSEIEAPNAAIGGILGNQPPNTGMMLSHASGVAVFPNAVAGGNRIHGRSGKHVYATLGSTSVEDTAFELWRDDFDRGSVYRFTYATKENISTINDQAAGWWELKGDNTTGAILAFSTDEAEADVGPHRLWFPAGFLLGDPRIGRVRVDTGFGPPTITGAPPPPGDWKKGDRILNVDPSPGDQVKGFEGWICTAPGNPGIWRGFGSIQL